MRSAPPKKAQFLPSKHEQQRVNRYIKLLREGRLVPARLRPPPPKEEPLADVWGDAVYVQSGARSSVHRGLPPPPKMMLPSHAESYNPPEEYLFTAEERAEWEATAPEERSLSFVPQKFSSLRRVPVYANLVLERFLRCQALYLSARKLKSKMNVDPKSLLPALPSRKSLLPYPRSVGLEYLPLAKFAQRLPPHQPLHAFLLSLPGETDCTPLRQFNEKELNCLSPQPRRLLGPGGGVLALTVDSSGSWLATGSADGAVRVFEVRTAKPVSVFQMQQKISALAFHPRLPVLAVAAGEQLLLLVLDIPVFKRDPLALTQLSVCGEKDKSKRKRRIDGGSSNPAAVHKEDDGNDEKGESGSSASLLLQEAMELLLVRTAIDPSLPDLLRFEEAGRRSTLGDGRSEEEEEKDSAVFSVDPTVGRRLRGEWLQVSMRSAKRVVRDLAKELHRGSKEEDSEEAFAASLPIRGVLRGLFILHDAPITKLKWQRKGWYLAAVCPGAGSPSAQLSIHALRKQSTLSPLKRFFKGALRDVSFFAEKPWLAVAHERGVRVFDLKARETNSSGPRQVTVKKLIGVDGASSLDVHPGGEHLIVGCESRKLILYDLQLSSRPFKNFKMHSRAITAAAFHPKFPLLATASFDGTIQVLHCRVFDDLETNPLVIPLKTLRVSEGAGVSTIAWHPFMPWLFSADAGGNCLLWR